MMIIKSDDSVDRGRIFISEKEIQFPSFDFWSKSEQKVAKL